MGRQIVAQGLHPFLVGARQIDTGYLVESDQVYPTVQALQQLHDLTTEGWRIVQTTETDILERTTALVREVVLLQQRHHLVDLHLTFGWHQHLTLFGQR